MTKDTGGLAFPATVQGWNNNLSRKQDGMTLRDWFAGQALAGIAAHPSTEITAECIYKLADAMIAERNKP